MGMDWMGMAGGLLSNLFGGKSAQAATPSFSQPSYSTSQAGLSPIAGNIFQHFQNSFTPQASQQSQGGFSGLIKNYLNPQQLANQNSIPQPGQVKQNGGILSMFGGAKGLSGAGLLGLGALMPAPNKVPQSTASLDQLRALQQSGGGPMNQAAQGKIQELLNQKLQPMTDQETNAIHQQYQLERDRRTKSLQDLYHNAQPGVDYLSSSNYMRDSQQLNDDLANQENTAIAQGRRQVQSDYNSQQMGAIGAANGMDNQNTQLLSQIAGMDMGQIMTQLQVNRDDAYYLKNLATQLGSGMMGQQPGFEQQLQLLAKYFPQVGRPTLPA